MIHSDHGEFQRRAGRRPLVAAVVALVAVGFFPASAQDGDVIDALRNEREAVYEQSVEAGERIDVVSASVDDLTAALDEINGLVRLQEVRLADAERVVAAARQEAATAAERLAAVDDEIETHRARIVELALSSFTGESTMASDELTRLAMSDDPGEAARLRHLLEVQTGSLSDALDRLRHLEVEAEGLVAQRELAIADAQAGVEVVARRSVDLADARTRQATLVTAARTRLEARLAEAAALAERDAELAATIRDEQQAINRRIAGIAQDLGVEIPAPVDLSEIVTVRFPEHRPDFSIEVHVDIADQTEALFTAAFEDGLDLTGFGYRPIQHQIELRAQHCGGAEEDIWIKPASECAPPTARPGFSLHEQGRAIDFFHNGRSIASRDAAAFRWLAAHAPAHGFTNLEVEPWHWSG